MEKTETDAPGFWGSVDPKVKTGLVIGATVLVVGGGIYYFARKGIQEHRSRKVLKNAIYEGSLESMVEKLNIAVDGAGTDEQKVYEAYSDIPTQNHVEKVQKLYEAAYDETLDEAMRGDLDSDEDQTIKNIVAGKPKFTGGKPNYDLTDDWIRRLKSAKGTFSTDEDAIYRVLWEVPDYNGYNILSTAIGKNTDVGYANLNEYLTGELDDQEQEDARYIMNRKSKDNEKRIS